MGAFDPLAEYTARTKKSASWHSQASEHLPGGVTGNVKFYSPYPVYDGHGEHGGLHEGLSGPSAEAELLHEEGDLGKMDEARVREVFPAEDEKRDERAAVKPASD